MEELYKIVNGVRIKMTQEEVAEMKKWESEQPTLPPDPIEVLEQQVDDLNLIMAEVLGGGF